MPPARAPRSKRSAAIALLSSIGRSCPEYGSRQVRLYNGGMLPTALPGADLIEEGLTDLSARRETISALLVSIGAPRLRSLGLDMPPPFNNPEHRLYELLAQSDSDSAHSRYNALIRRLVSFERAWACVR